MRNRRMKNRRSWRTKVRWKFLWSSVNFLPARYTIWTRTGECTWATARSRVGIGLLSIVQMTLYGILMHLPTVQNHRIRIYRSVSIWSFERLWTHRVDLISHSPHLSYSQKSQTEETKERDRERERERERSDARSTHPLGNDEKRKKGESVGVSFYTDY